MQKLIIIGFTAIIILFGGVITVMQQMELGPFATGVDDKSNQTGKGNGAGKNSAKSKPHFIEMDPITIPVIVGDSVAAVQRIELKVGFNLDITATKTAELRNIEEKRKKIEKLEKYMPKLQNAFIIDLHSFIPSLYRRSSKLDKKVLANRLRAIGHRAIGKGKIRLVKITKAKAQRSPKK